MKTFTFVNIFVNFCAILINLANCKPVPDLESYPEGCVHSGQKSDITRSRRSITEMDAVNPAYLETKPQSRLTREELSDPGKDKCMSLYAISDSVDGFFRGHKGQDVQKLPTKQRPGDPAENQGKDEQMVRRDVLSADEQDDCYKQQNIDPPGPRDGPPRPFHRVKDYSPYMDMNVQLQQRLPSRPLVYKDKGSKKLKDESNDIMSLYSDPERGPKLKKEKIINAQPKHYALEQFNERSVYKPIGVKAEFPVYDEDIDFHPDPLQGILEDKYWLDPQEQEAVIKKYIDLASNMQPYRVDYMKRDAPRGEHIPKSVDSKEAFRDAEAAQRECPCREVVSCEDCSKGKWRKKTNYSEREVPCSNGNVGTRDFLLINYDNTENRESDGESAVKIRDSQLKSNNKDYVSEDGYKNEQYSEDINSRDYGELDWNEEENKVEEAHPSFTSNYFGRKLLSFEDDESTKYDVSEDDDTDNTEYELPEDVQVTEDPLLFFKRESSDEYDNKAKKNYNRRSIIFDGNINVEDKRFNDHYTSLLKPSSSGRYEFNLETEKLGDINKYTNPNTTSEFFQMQRPFLDKPHKLERYYVPNKFGNLLQKTIIKQKPKESSSTIDPDLEFAIERNQTFLNVSMEMNDLNVSVTTDMAKLIKYHEKRGDQPVAKGRRSYDVPLMKHPHVKTLQDDLTNVKAQDSNNTGNTTSSVNADTSVNVTSPVNTTLPTTTSSNVSVTYDSNSNSTDNTTDVPTDTILTQTENTTTEEYSTAETKKKKIEEYDEDLFDAEVANDIVETVIAESQSGSVVGHNLGLCRRNSTISKYAKVSPESEKLMKKVTECILEHIRDRLEGQSCTLLDDELLQFLKWMVLSGESYKDYIARVKPQYREFKSEVNIEAPAPKIDGIAHFSSVAPK